MIGVDPSVRQVYKAAQTKSRDSIRIIIALVFLTPDLLAQLYQFLNTLKKASHPKQHPFLKFAGTLSDEGAAQIRRQERISVKDLVGNFRLIQAITEKV